MYNYIAIEGIIGAGKTTLCNTLCRALEAESLLEQFEENTFLEKFYESPEAYAFTLEMSFLASRYHQLNHILSKPNLFPQMTISDFVFYKSLVFAANNLKNDELQLFRKLFDIMFNKLPKPDLTIYLNISIAKAQSNIRKRGRDFEFEITDQYLHSLHEQYLKYFGQLQNETILILNMEDRDIMNSPEDFEWILGLIQKPYTPGIHYF